MRGAWYCECLCHRVPGQVIHVIPCCTQYQQPVEVRVEEPESHFTLLRMPPAEPVK
jgi:hypothetical protein